MYILFKQIRRGVIMGKDKKSGNEEKNFKKEWIQPEITDFDVKTETSGLMSGAWDGGGYS